MFKLINSTSGIVEMESVPSDSVIHDILENFFNSMTVTTNESGDLKHLMENSLMKTIPNLLDYRNINVDSHVKKFKSFTLNLECNPLLKKPLLEILGVVNNYSLEEQDCNLHTSSLVNEANQLNEDVYLQDLEVLDFAMALYKNQYIPTRFMEEYVYENRDHVMLTVRDLTSRLREKTHSNMINRGDVITIPTCITESYPNDVFIDTMFDAIYESDFGYSSMDLSISDEEFKTLALDFMSDESKKSLINDSKTVYDILCSFVDDTYNNIYDIDKFINIAYDIRQAYLENPTYMLHYTLKFIVIAIQRLCSRRLSLQEHESLMRLKNAIMIDVSEYQDMDAVISRSNDEIYTKILSLWNSPFSLGNTYLDKSLEKVEENKQDVMNHSTESSMTLESIVLGFNEEVNTSFGKKETLPSDAIRALTESFEVLQDGTIKVTIDRNSTYMNEYMTNHRLLLANKEMGNWEAVKYNLVYDLILIESIEKNVIYNKKITKGSELYNDAEKARRFAKNDVNTYLPELRQHVKKFDLNKFYKEVKADKNTVKIDTVSTISGVKKIINSILL